MPKALGHEVSRVSSPRKSKEQMDLPGKVGGGRGKANKSKPHEERPLPSAASLRDMVDAKLKEVATLEAAEQTVQASSLPRQIGAALAGQSKSPKDLIREWDTNGDGKISPIELRQVVRNKLHIKADNKAIDSLFKELDDDSSGALDNHEMQTAFQKFLKASKEAQKEATSMEERADALRYRAIQLEQAAKALDKVEARAAMASDTTGMTLERRVAVAVLKSAAKIDKMLSAWDVGHGGTISAEDLGKRVHDLKVEATEAEVQSYYKQLLGETHAAPGASLNLKLALRKIYENRQNEVDRQKVDAEEAKKERMEARRLVREVEALQQKEEALQKEQAAEAERVAARIAEEAKQAERAKEEAKEALQAKKEAQKANFELKVAMKRAASSHALKGGMVSSEASGSSPPMSNRSQRGSGSRSSGVSSGSQSRDSSPVPTAKARSSSPLPAAKANALW